MKSVRIAKVFRALIYSLSFFLFVSFSQTETINIPEDYLTIQEGIEVAEDYDTVLVADGIYTENINFLGKAIAVRSENGHEATTIEIQNTGIPVVTFNTNENTNSVLEGFTVNGDLSYWGVYCDHSSPFIYNNVIKNHECGIKVDFGSPIIRKNEISFCDHSEIEPHVGGGIQLMNSNDVVIDSNVIHNNWANVSGGIHTDGCSNVRVERNLIYSNDCVYVSGIKIDRGSNFVIINNTLVDNSASDRLGVILFWDSNDISIINNICAFNNEWGIYSWGSSYNIVVDFNDTYENSPGNINGIEPGPGSIYTNPMFVDIYNNNYQLTAGSPCINAGNPDSPLDPDGTIADIGALYFDISVSEFTLDIDEVLGEQGQPVEVPIFAYGLEAQEIAGTELHIGYDASCLDFLEISSEYLTDALVNEEEGQVHILWEDYLNPFVIPEDGTILSLHFTVLGELGQTCSIEWMDNNELVDPIGEIVQGIEYLPGSVTSVVFSSISGNIHYYDLVKVVADATVELTGDDDRTTTSGEDGSYMFEELAPGEYTLAPSYAEDNSGVTVSDIVSIRRHIVYLELFDSPYKSIAADVNINSMVSVADIILLRRYLAELDDLPSGNWAFVDSSFEITEENWPEAPHHIDTELLYEDISGLNFIGIRMGDVDNSWGDGGLLLECLTDSVVIQINNTSGMPDESVLLPVAVTGVNDVAGIELHLEYPDDDLNYTTIISDILDEPTTNGGNGEIHLIWEDISNTLTLDDGEQLLSIEFEILENAPDSMPVSFTITFVVDEFGNDFYVESIDGFIILDQTEIGEDLELLSDSYMLTQNYPNPFNSSTIIQYNLPDETYVTVNIYDLLGRNIETLVSQQQTAGFYQIAWNADHVPSGIYFYKIQTSDFSSTKKMILMK